MSIKINNKTAFGIVLIFMCLSFLGCARNIAIKDNLFVFKERMGKLPLHAGLYLDDETRKHVISKYSYNFLVGEALAQNAPLALQEVFVSGAVITDMKNPPAEIRRVVVLSFGAGSKMEFGPTVFSDHAATVEIICRVYDRQMNLLWEGQGTGYMKRKIPTAAAAAGPLDGIFGLFGKGSVKSTEEAQQETEGAYGVIMTQGLNMALENINDQILSSGREKILIK